MEYMFYNCSSLTTLNLSNCNYNDIKKLLSEIKTIKSLQNLDLSNFNTNNVKDMSEMFSYCSSLNSLNLSNFNTNNVNNMRDMFSSVNKEKCKLICENDRIVKEFEKN